MNEHDLSQPDHLEHPPTYASGGTSEQPQEWTPEYVLDTWGQVLTRKLAKDIADAYNAAVAAEQRADLERGRHEGSLHHMEACRALLNVPDDEVLYEAIKELQEQLASEQEKTKLQGKYACELFDECKKLQQQLTAEREKHQ